MPHLTSVIDPSAVPVALPAFECAQREGGFDTVCVHVAGELDMYSTPRLRQTLRDALLGKRLIVLDLRDVVFMDSSAVHVIVGASVCARHDGRRLVVLRGPPGVDCVFALTATTDQVEFRDEPVTRALLQVVAEDVAS
jgi:anti-anti-sigma factor